MESDAPSGQGTPMLAGQRIAAALAALVAAGVDPRQAAVICGLPAPRSPWTRITARAKRAWLKITRQW